MNISPRLRLVILGAALTLVCGTLAAIIASQLDASLSATPGEGINPTAASTEETAPELPSYSLPPLSDFAALSERPLFSRTRRPTLEDEAAPVPVAQGGLEVVLTGVIIAGEKRVALIVPKNAAKPVRLAEGERFQGWTLSEVETEGVIFRQGTRAQILELNHKAANPAANRLTRQPQSHGREGQKS